MELYTEKSMYNDVFSLHISGDISNCRFIAGVAFMHRKKRRKNPEAKSDPDISLQKDLVGPVINPINSSSIALSPAASVYSYAIAFSEPGTSTVPSVESDPAKQPRSLNFRRRLRFVLTSMCAYHTSMDE